jgi:hypothetical protein
VDGDAFVGLPFEAANDMKIFNLGFGDIVEHQFESTERCDLPWI